MKKKNRACHGPTLVGRPGVGPARPGPLIFDMMDRGPARPVNFSEDGPRPGPAHQIFRGWAAARPSPSHFQKFTARPIIFSNASARPGPANHAAAMHMRHGLYMGRPDNYVGRPVDLSGPAHVLSLTRRYMCIR